MKDETFDFWQDHSLRFLEMAFRTDRCETLEHPDGMGSRTGDCGDTVTVYLTEKRGRIETISFQVDGCMNTTACANAVSELVEGKPVEQAWNVKPETVIAYLQTLPKAHRHCAELAVGALYLALADLRRRAGKAA